MRDRILAALTFCLLLGAFCFGQSVRSSFTNITSEPNFLNQLHAAQCPEELVMTQCARMKEILPDFPTILRVTPVEDVTFLYHSSRQKMQVQEVYKSDSLADGDLFYLTGISLSLGGAEKSLECHFVHPPEVGKSYLIFLEGCIETKEVDLPVYAHTEETLFPPIFCLDDFAYVGSNEMLENSTYASYATIRNSEFFTYSQTAYDAWHELKQSMLELFS